MLAYPTCGQEVVDPLLYVLKRHVETRGDHTTLVDAPGQLGDESRTSTKPTAAAAKRNKKKIKKMKGRKEGNHERRKILYQMDLEPATSIAVYK